MLAGAARDLSAPLWREGGPPRRDRYGDDSAYRAALDLHEAGVAVAGIVDLRADSARPSRQARRRAFRCSRRRGRRHRRRRRRVSTASTRAVERRGCIACELLLMSRRLDAVGASVLPVARQAAVRCRGAGLPARRIDRAGALAPAPAPAHSTCRHACATGTRAGGARPRSVTPDATTAAPIHAATPPAGRDAEQGVRRFPERRHRQGPRARRARRLRLDRAVKRYTTTGMATDQGKTANMNALAIVAGAAGRDRCRRSARRPSARPTRR